MDDQTVPRVIILVFTVLGAISTIAAWMRFWRWFFGLLSKAIAKVNRKRGHTVSERP